MGSNTTPVFGIPSGHSHVHSHVDTFCASPMAIHVFGQIVPVELELLGETELELLGKTELELLGKTELELLGETELELLLEIVCFGMSNE